MVKQVEKALWIGSVHAIGLVWVEFRRRSLHVFLGIVGQHFRIGFNSSFLFPEDLLLAFQVAGINDGIHYRTLIFRVIWSVWRLEFQFASLIWRKSKFGEEFVGDRHTRPISAHQMILWNHFVLNSLVKSLFHSNFSLLVVPFFLLNLLLFFNLESFHIGEFLLRIWVHFVLKFGKSGLVLLHIRLLIFFHQTLVLLISLTFTLRLFTNFQGNLWAELLIIASFSVTFKFNPLHLLLQIGLQFGVSFDFFKFWALVVNLGLANVLVDDLAPHVISLHLRNRGCPWFCQQCWYTVTWIYYFGTRRSRILPHIKSIIWMIVI